MAGKGSGGPRGKGGGGNRNSRKIGSSLRVSGTSGGCQKCTAAFRLDHGKKSTCGGGRGGKGGGGAGISRKCGSSSGGSSRCVGAQKRKATFILEDYGSGSTGMVQMPSVMGGMGMMLGRDAEQSRVHEKVSKTCYENKKNGSYSRLTTKEKVSSKDFVDFYSGRVGTKKDVKVTSTLKFGDKSMGFSGEFVTEHKYQNVKHFG